MTGLARGGRAADRVVCEAESRDADTEVFEGVCAGGGGGGGGGSTLSIKAKIS